MRLFVKLLFIFFSLNIFSTQQNTLGTVGVFLTPSARFFDEGTLSLNLTRQESFNKGNLLAQPYDWMEFSLFYADILGKDYPASLGQSYKDKGFNLKFKLLDETKVMPQLAVGLTDFAGTGLFSGEYIVASKQVKRLDFSVGIGWGLYSGYNNFSNPLIKINNSFENRNYQFGDTIGEFDFEDYFSGSKASLFSSALYKINEKSSLAFEINPVEGIERFDEVQPLSKNYFGYIYNNNSYFLSIFLGSSDDINFSFGILENFSNQKKQFIKSRDKLQTKDAQFVRSLQLNKIALKEISISDDGLMVGIRQNNFENVEDSVNFTLKSLYESGYTGYDEIIVKNFSFGEEISYHKINNEEDVLQVSKPNNDYQKIFNLEENFPQFQNSLYPGLKTFIGSREAFLFNSLTLNLNNKVFFSESSFIDTLLSVSVANDFDGLYLEPVTTYPEQVRSDVKDYLRNHGEGINIERMEYSKIKKLNTNNFISIKAGLFESMFGGYGLEYLHLDRFANTAFGFEIFHVKKRGYENNFDFLDYEKVTGHINFYHYLDSLQLTTHISWGQYLAGDEGMTIDLSKRFENGLKFGAFFTLTDVTFDQYGEGSFNKGIYFSLPIKNILNNSENVNFSWSPLTKDPGQKLNLNTKLFGLLERYIY